jgi:hypothetical protein
MQLQRGQYNNVLANDTYLVAFVKRLDYMTSGLWISKANLQKANFILQSLQNPFNQNFIYEGLK